MNYPINQFPSIRWILSVLASLLLSAAPSYACKVKAIFVEPADDAPDKAVLVVGKNFVDIDLPQRNLSTPIEITGGEIGIGVLPTKPSQLDMPASMPRFIIPPEWTHCILIFFHDPANKVFPARIIPVNTSAADFPPGHTIIFNVTTATLAAKFGSDLVRVMPGKSVIVKPPRAGSGDYPIAIDFANPGDKQPTALCRSTWQHEAAARQFLFVTSIPGQKMPRVWGVLDRPDQEVTTDDQAEPGP